jgi:hypothetical protein
MKMLDGETVTVAVSLLLSVTVMPPAGAGDPKVTGNATDWPMLSVVVGGKLIVAGAMTVTFRLAEVMLAGGLDRMTVDPAPTPVT